VKNQNLANPPHAREKFGGRGRTRKGEIETDRSRAAAPSGKATADY